MDNIILNEKIANQTKLKIRSNGIIEAIEKENSSLLNFSGVLDLTKDKISGFELRRKIERIKNCSSILEWRDYSGDVKLHNANFCRVPDGCPICAKRLQRNRVRRFKDPIIKASKHFKYAYFITFTVQNTHDLRSGLNDLLEGLKRFRRQGQKRRQEKRSSGQWGKVKAGMISIEIKRGTNSKMWHPHAHGLIFTDEQIDYKANKEVIFNGEAKRASSLSMDWLRATEGKSINIDCRPLYGRKIIKKGKAIWRDVWSQSLEILKYNTKLLNGDGTVNASDLGTILCAGYAKRKFNTYGEFRKPESVFYCGPLEPYTGEIPEGFKGRPTIYSQIWIDGKYSRLNKEDRPVIEEYKKCLWRTLSAQIQGKFKKRKYRIIRIRDYFIKRGRLDDFEKALEENEKIKLSALKMERESLHDEKSESELKSFFFERQELYRRLMTRDQFIDYWYHGVEPENMPEAA